MFGYSFGVHNFQWSRTADVRTLHVQSDIRYRYAHTLVHSDVLNTADTAQEVTLSFTLPETAFISSFSIEIDGKVYTAYVKGKEEAQRIYSEAVQHGKTAGHVAVSARDSNQFNVSVNVEQKKNVIFRLTYEELLSRKLGMYKHIINLDPGQIVQDFSVKVNIVETTDITELKVATLKQHNEAEYSALEMGNSLTNIDRPNPHTAVVIFAPTPDQQQALSTDGLRGQFIVQYDVDRSALHSQILVSDGYFTHYFAPEQLKPLPKHVTFVLDISGSMQGRKMNQLKEAMEKILSDLYPQDYFSLLTFSSGVQIWRLATGDGNWDNATVQESDCDSLVVPATEQNTLRGKLAIYKLKANGNTNVHLAMMVATHISELRKKLKCSQPPEPIIIFLTDGQPTIGILNREEIISETTRLNEIGKGTIFTLGLGNDVDFEFLKKLALRNSGFARRIYEASDSALQLTDFYKEVSSPLLSNITFIYQPEQVEPISVTKHNFVTFFGGSELIVSGRIDPSISKREFRFGVTGNSSEGMRNFLPEETRVFFLKKPDFMERLWAYLTVQQLLDEEKKLEGQMSSNKKQEAMQLALKYSFVTPVTSLVVVRPDDQHYRARLGSGMERMNVPTVQPQFGSLFGSSNSNNVMFGAPCAAVPQAFGFNSNQGIRSGSSGAVAFGQSSFSFGSANTVTDQSFGQSKTNQGLFGTGQTITNQGFGTSPSPTNQGLFGSGQITTNEGLFGSGQSTQNQGLFGSGQSATSQGLFGYGQSTTNQGFGTSPSPTNQGVFGSGQITTNEGLFGSGQSTQSQGLFGSGQSATSQGLFGYGQSTTNQGLFGSGQSATNQGLFGSEQSTTNQGLFGSGQSATNQGSSGFTFGQNVPGGQDTDAIKAHFVHDKASNTLACKICSGLILGDVPENLEKHLKALHPTVLTSSTDPKAISVCISQNHLIDALTDMVLVDKRPLSMLSDSWLKKILDPIATGLNISITANMIHQKIADRCYQVEQIISKELANALICLELEIAMKLGETFLAIHAQYSSEGKKIIRTLTTRNLNPGWNKNHIIDIVINTFERFNIKNVFYVTINIVKNIAEFLSESPRTEMSNDENDSVDDNIFKIILDACTMLGMSIFWNPTYIMQHAVHQTMKTHQEIIDKVKDLKLPSQGNDEHSGMVDAVEQNEIATIKYISQTLKSLLTSFHQNQCQFGDVYNMWTQSQEKISNLGTPFAETLSTNMKKSAGEILQNPVFLSLLFLDPRYKNVLNDEQNSSAIEELKRVWGILSNLKDVDVISNEVEIVEKLKVFATTPQMSEDTDILQYWESQNQQPPDLKKLATVLLSVPILQNTKERLSLNFDILLSKEPINVKQDVVKVRCYNAFN